MEVHLKKYFSDKTGWKKMLKNQHGSVNLVDEKKKLFELLTDELKEYFVRDDKIYRMEYPGAEYADKISSINLKKESKFKGVLRGVRGQYLIFSRGEVLNVRTHAGMLIEMTL